MTRCPTDLAVEALLLSRPGAGVADHVESCPRCQQRVAQARQAGETFRSQIAPRALPSILARAAPRRRAPIWLVLTPVPLAAMAALLLVVARTPRTPAEDYVGTKGELGFVVYASDGAGAVALSDGAQLGRTARLRFRLQVQRPCWTLVVSVDEAGRVSRLFPSEDEDGALVAHSGALPGGAVLTGTGPERLFALCSPTALAFSRIASSLRQVTTSDAVRRTRVVPGLPEGVLQATILVERTP